jgi:hypothetical protein
MSLYSIHLRPWLLAAEALRPSRSIISSATADKEKTMNILGVKVSIEPATPRQRWTRRVAALGVANAVVMGGGLAYANWTTSGSGSGAASAGTAVAVNGTVASISSSPTLLVPGGSAPLIVNVHNPNSFSVKISAVTLTAGQQPSGISGAKTPANCTAVSSGVALANVAATTAFPVTITGGGDATVSMASGAVTMALSSDDGCQGASFAFANGIAVTAAAG